MVHVVAVVVNDVSGVVVVFFLWKVDFVDGDERRPLVSERIKIFDRI